MKDHSSRNHNVSEEVDMPMNESNGEENDLGKEDMDAMLSNEQVDCSSAFTTEEVIKVCISLLNYKCMN
ncbi:hypothetical protein L6164_001602 [Bauhinia variegata]|uniref:Uncharacterized protein n=1 Tax=Bauhinia variegata TaxID=167791 RepID=A0ACB9QA10_BAUVA|nr:hypothetical protein L6164_001602 [Bauhinia variegata]